VFQKESDIISVLTTQSWGIWNSHENHEHAQYKQYNITIEPHGGGGTELHAELNGANATAEAVYLLFLSSSLFHPSPFPPFAGAKNAPPEVAIVALRAHPRSVQKD
jgi:hypothetical protein